MGDRWHGHERCQERHFPLNNALDLKRLDAAGGSEARFLGIKDKSRGHIPQKVRSLFG